MVNTIKSLADVAALQVDKGRKLFSATHEEILSGATTDIYFIKTLEILKHMQLEESEVVAEVFARKHGVLAGMDEALALFEHAENLEIYGLEEGQSFAPKQTIMRIKGPYHQFGAMETPLLGFLASSSGWATAAAEIKAAANNCPVTVFGARHVHPAIAPVMERAALIGGVNASSCILGAKLAGFEPMGTAPHALFLIAGDTLKAAIAYDQCLPASSARVILVDTFKDEAEESLRLAKAMEGHLAGVRLDTPSERGGVTGELVSEIRARLDLAGFNDVKIFVSGGLNPERLQLLYQAGAEAFGVGSYISGAKPIDMTMDIKQVNGQDIAKRGRVPGLSNNCSLKKLR